MLPAVSAPTDDDRDDRHARHDCSGTLAAWATEATEAMIEQVVTLPADALLGPALAIVNPPLWELGHVGWFLERFCLREALGAAPLRADEDALWDSIVLPHDGRWDLALPSLAETVAYVRTVTERVCARVIGGDLAGPLAATVRLAVHHADMHVEALVYTRQTLGYAPPPGCPPCATPLGERDLGDARVPGGVVRLGAAEGAAFAFDNELPPCAVQVEPFRIARAAVSEGELALFVADGGYETERLWSDAGRVWRAETGARLPAYWTRDPDGALLVRRFDERRPPAPDLPALFVSCFEAEAFCAWAGRRLPSEAEWELAATLDATGRKRTYPWGETPPTPARARLGRAGGGPAPVHAHPEGDSACGCRQMLGNVWEWTATPFEPFPGFRPGVYREYSEPWFGTRRVLKGCAWTTPPRMAWASWRNFYEPHRRDVLAGFRTCAR
jgi:iron(II)-dependent oxidoreductase